jgi:hypothetical protein
MRYGHNPHNLRDRGNRMTMASNFEVTLSLRGELASHQKHGRLTLIGAYAMGDHVSVLSRIPSLHAHLGYVATVDVELDRMRLQDRLATQSLIKLAVAWSAARKSISVENRYTVTYLLSSRDAEQAHAARVIVSMDPIGASYRIGD